MEDNFVVPSQQLFLIGGLNKLSDRPAFDWIKYGIKRKIGWLVWKLDNWFVPNLPGLILDLYILYEPCW